MDIRTKIVSGLVGAAVVGGVGYAGWYNSDREVAKRLVKDVLVDPDSAKFYDLKACSDGNGGRFLTGEVNSRNSNGGMTGKKTFLVRDLGAKYASASIADGGASNRNPAELYVDAFINSPIGADCTAIYKIAEKMAANRSNGDGSIGEMNATEGMDTLDDMTPDLIEPLPPYNGA